MRTYVRADRGHDPARRSRLVLRVRRAARRSPPARPPGDRRGGSRARGQLRGQGVRRAHGDGRRAGLAAVPERDRRRSPRMSAYSEASKAVFEVFSDTTPLVEGLSIDEAFLDVGGLRRIVGDARPRSRSRLRRDVRERVGLPITVGVARTKFLAKVASGVAKPDGLLVVPPDDELALPASAAGRTAVGCRAGDRDEAARARDHNGRRGCPVRRDRRWSRSSVARPGRHLHALAHNRDPRPVQVGRRRGSIGSQCALGRATEVAEAIDAVIVGLVDRVTRRMRAAGRVGRTVVLRLRFGDFTRATRSHTLPRGDRAYPHDPRDGACAARRRDAARSSVRGSRSSGSPSATSMTTEPSSSRCPSTIRVALPSTRHSMTSASGSGPPLSLGRSCSGAMWVGPFPCFRIERAALIGVRSE